jgi:hypothetical protein
MPSRFLARSSIALDFRIITRRIEVRIGLGRLDVQNAAVREVPSSTWIAAFFSSK